MRTEVIEIFLLPKDDEHEQVKNGQIPWFIPLHSTADLLLFSTSERFVGLFKFFGPGDYHDIWNRDQRYKNRVFGMYIPVHTGTYRYMKSIMVHRSTYLYVPCMYLNNDRYV
jgi:hypothetical protein